MVRLFSPLLIFLLVMDLVVTGLDLMVTRLGLAVQERLVGS